MTITEGCALVTGASGTIGSAVVAGLASAGLDLIVSCRPGGEARCRERVEQSIGQRSHRRMHVEVVDFAHLDSLNDFVKRVRQRFAPCLRVVVQAAAVAPPKTRRLTADGLETTFHVNVLPVFAIMDGLLEVLHHNSPASVVNVASTDFGHVDLQDLQLERRRYSAQLAYGQSKAAVQLLTWEAAAQNLPHGGPPSIFYNAIHPGNVRSQMNRGRHTVDTPAIAASRVVWLAINAPRLRLTGTWWEMSRNGSGISEQLPRLYDASDQVRHDLWVLCSQKVHQGASVKVSSGRHEQQKRALNNTFSQQGSHHVPDTLAVAVKASDITHAATGASTRQTDMSVSKISAALRPGRNASVAWRDGSNVVEASRGNDAGYHQLWTENGFFVLNSVFSPGKVDAMANMVTSHMSRLLEASGANDTLACITSPGDEHCRPQPNSMGWTAFDIGADKTLRLLFDDVVTNMRVRRALKNVLGNNRPLSRNEVLVDTTVGWHQDLPNTVYRVYTKGMPTPWGRSEVDNSTHKIASVCMYLQDHTNDTHALTVKPGTHSSPPKHYPHQQTQAIIRMKTKSVPLHPQKGDVVIFDSRLAHRGADVAQRLKALRRVERHRILLTITFGQNKNRFTDRYERAFAARNLAVRSPQCAGDIEGHCAAQVVRDDLLANPLDAHQLSRRQPNPS